MCSFEGWEGRIDQCFWHRENTLARVYEVRQRRPWWAKFSGSCNEQSCMEHLEAVNLHLFNDLKQCNLWHHYHLIKDCNLWHHYHLIKVITRSSTWISVRSMIQHPVPWCGGHYYESAYLSTCESANSVLDPVLTACELIRDFLKSLGHPNLWTFSSANKPIEFIFYVSRIANVYGISIFIFRFPSINWLNLFKDSNVISLRLFRHSARCTSNTCYSADWLGTFRRDNRWMLF